VRKFLFLSSAGVLLEKARTAYKTAMADARHEAAQRQAIRQLKAELGNVAVELAEKIVGEALADDERQRRLIDRFLNDIEEEANRRR